MGKQPNKFDAICFAALLAGFAVVWLAVTAGIPGSLSIVKDEAWHTGVVYEAMATADTYSDVAMAESDYPPFFYLTSFAAGKTLGSLDRITVALPNLILLLALLFVVRLLSRELFSEKGALLAALLVGLRVFGYSLKITPQMTVVFSVVLFTYACVRLPKKADAIDALLLVGGTALTLLSKQTAPVFFVVPLLWCAWRLLEQRSLSTRKGAVFGLSLIAGGFIAYLAFYRYIPVDELYRNIFRRGVTMWGQVPKGSGHVMEHLTFYPALVLKGLAIPSLLLIAAAVFGKLKHSGVLIWTVATVLAPVALFTAFPSKAMEWTLPIVPVMIVSVVGALAQISESKWFHRAIVIIVLLSSAVPLGLSAWNQARDYAGAGAVLGPAYRETAEGLSRLSKVDSVRALQPINEQSVGAFNNDLVRQQIQKVPLEVYRPGPEPPDYLVVFRRADLFDPEKCLSRAEIESRHIPNVAPLEPWDRAAFELAMNDYDVVSHAGKAVRFNPHNLGPITICRKNPLDPTTPTD
jgi:Dolichyl-phosphate-mannose-protein mannosyltransferase